MTNNHATTKSLGTSSTPASWRTTWPFVATGEYYDSRLYKSTHHGSMSIAIGALCPDGRRRNAYPSSRDGQPDTFFSIPAYVHARKNGKNVRVYGYVTTDRHPVTGAETVMFRAYRYRKHADAVSAPFESKAQAVEAYREAASRGHDDRMDDVALNLREKDQGGLADLLEDEAILASLTIESGQYPELEGTLQAIRKSIDGELAEDLGG